LIDVFGIEPSTGCGGCDNGLVHSSIIIGIVIWLLLLTIFFIVLLAVLLTSATSLHRAPVGRVPGVTEDAGRPTTAAVVSLPARSVTRSRRVPRRFSTTPSQVEPWMKSLSENVWKDYKLETINDNK